MDFYHTGVPESQRGKGIAGQLVKVKLNRQGYCHCRYDPLSFARRKLKIPILRTTPTEVSIFYTKIVATDMFCPGL